MTNRFPAILIGGPPHAGKSVLAHSLKESLAQAGVAHYLLRAAPDGEGDWFHQAPTDVAETQRRKGCFTPTWVEQISQDIARRPLPFLVDVGGEPQPWQEQIFDQCTHAILLVKWDESRAYWQAMMEKYNLPIIALLTSRLEGQDHLETDRPVLRGTITHLSRGQAASGPVFEALLAHVKALVSYSHAELLNIHQRQAPTDLVVDLVGLHRTLKPTVSGYNWQPQELPVVLNYLPSDDSIALYGRGPVWLYAAVAASIYPLPFYQFDARRGWVEPVRLAARVSANLPVTITARQTDRFLHLKLELSADYLEYQPALALPLPPVPTNQGVILDGKLPVWLYTGLVTYYHPAPWVAVYYPHRDEAVIAASTDDPGAVGQTLTITDTA